MIPMELWGKIRIKMQNRVCPGKNYFRVGRFCLNCQGALQKKDTPSHFILSRQEDGDLSPMDF
ncbi:hypothetical protein EC392_02535 [Lonsdalea populi]|uniref:Uncharacterized protein n=1 Tax=Lonsdalea populi TaxID=1172565 RepID=A0A3N0UTM1_9GAMM|nr:hypothetical protein EC393_06085 [Lonsdalea populi]ROH83909.1 hypothetical protein EC392_02535 [Lonsdalea populi]ROH84302.1 hypothetical protein EC394_02660 [Lonsdalea populi]